MSAVPPVAPRVLNALHPGTAGAGLARETSTLVACTFVRLEAALDVRTAALGALDRIEPAVIAAHGYPRVPLPDTGGPPSYAVELRSRKAVFVRAARGTHGA